MAYKDDPRKYHRDYYYKRRQRLLDYLGGGPCAVCGSEDNLEFDHINPADKTFNISFNMTLNDHVKAELDKCQILCRSCHLAKSVSEKDPFTHGSLYGWMKKKCSCAKCYTAKRQWHDDRNAKRRKAD